MITRKQCTVQYFDAYLNNFSEKNHFASLCGERINIIFVQGGAAYYHWKHVSEYLEECSIQQNKLLSSVTDIEVKLYQACFLDTKNLWKADHRSTFQVD